MDVFHGEVTEEKVLLFLKRCFFFQGSGVGSCSVVGSCEVAFLPLPTPQLLFPIQDTRAVSILCCTIYYSSIFCCTSIYSVFEGLRMTFEVQPSSCKESAAQHRKQVM